MRSIQELLKEEKKLWIYLRDQEAEQKFVEELNQLGAKYLNGAQVTTQNCSPIMAVYPDLRVAHLMIMIWNASFLPSFDQHYAGDTSKILKIDYARYIEGQEDYLCSRSEFTPVI